MPHRILRTLSLFFLFSLSALAADTIPPIPRVLPPEGLEIPADVRTRLESRLAELKKRIDEIPAARSSVRLGLPNLDWLRERTSNLPDVEVFIKAVEYAILHSEFYVPKDFEKADWLLDQAAKRLDSLSHQPVPWARTTGLVVRGHRSRIDRSVQPYGLVIPENHDFAKPCPLYVWLHGRGDKNTDLHFLYERATKAGQIAPAGAIVLHPFGRHCVGYKAAGELDVHEAVAHVKREYKIDSNRVVLIGFSMGGAGAWQVGAHSASDWAAISPGAGFAETAQYQRITPDKYPTWYEQKLWGANDVPNYVRNLFNTKVIAYSGELDKQIQAARIMEQAYQAEGRLLTHLIGPGVEHKYEPGTLTELMQRLNEIVTKGHDEYPTEVHLQTRTLKYPRQTGVFIEGLEEHWLDSRLDMKRIEGKVDIQTKNISQFRLSLRGDAISAQIAIDGHSLAIGQEGQGLNIGPTNVGLASFIKREGQWEWLSRASFLANLHAMKKRNGLQGPIDDAFTERFLIVTPTGKSKNPRFQSWVDFELAHFQDRWRALMRGEPPMKKDVDFSGADLQTTLPPNVILWGDPDSNAAMAPLLEKTPIQFKNGSWSFGDQEFNGDQFVPAMAFPVQTRASSFNYLVLNSGLTFREGHDRTNSQQNPKLPDWAIIDITQPPDALSPGRIHDADFFDEAWQLKRQPKAP